MRFSGSKILLVSLLLISILASSVLAETGKGGPPEFLIGVGLNSLYDVDVKDATVAFGLWSKELGDTRGFKVESIVYKEGRALIDDFTRGKVDLAILKIVDFLRFRRASEYYDIAITNVMGSRKTKKYMLLVRSDSGIAGLKLLKGKRLATVKNDDVANLYLDTLHLKEKLQEPVRFYSLIEEKIRPSQAILAVFFGQADACVVNDVSLSIVSELNPQIKEKLKVITSSEGLIQGVGIFRKSYDPQHKQVVLDRILNLKEHARGQQVLVLFKSDRFELVGDQELAGMRNLLNEHDKLKKRH